MKIRIEIDEGLEEEEVVIRCRELSDEIVGLQRQISDGLNSKMQIEVTKKDITYELNWQDFNLTDTQVSKMSTNFDTTVYKVYNLWTHKMEGKTSKKSKVERKLTIKARDVIAYRLIK